VGRDRSLEGAWDGVQEKAREVLDPSGGVSGDDGRRQRVRRYLITRARHLAEFTVFPLRRVHRHLPLLVPPQLACLVRASTAPASLRTLVTGLIGRRLAVVGGYGIQRTV